MYSLFKRNYDLVAMAVFLFIVIVLSACGTFGQSSTTLSRRCPGASPVVDKALVDVEKDGDISLTPCDGRSIFINGDDPAGLITSINGLTATAQLFAVGGADTAAWSSTTATHTLRLPITAVSGSSRTNFFPYFNAANTFAKSPFSWDGTQFNWGNTAGDNTFLMNFTPSKTDTGVFTVGQLSGGSNTDNYLELNQNTGISTFRGGVAETQIRVGGQIELDTQGNVQMGDLTGSGNEMVAEINDSASYFRVKNGEGKFFLLDPVNLQYSFGDIDGQSSGLFFNIDADQSVFKLASGQPADTILDLQDIVKLQYQRTFAISSGNTTIQAPVGTVNFAAAATDLVVTNSNAAADSIIFCTIQSNDATATSCRVTDRAAGSFHIRLNAGATGTTTVGFMVTN